MEITYTLEGKCENGKNLFCCKSMGNEIDVDRILQIKRLCNEWKIEFEDLIIYFIEHLTLEEAERIIDDMDLCGVKAQFEMED